jgi:hypothetical protein
MSDVANRSARHQLAAANNGDWCGAVWRAHGLEVVCRDGMTACLGAPRRFYPNAVTLDPDTDPSAQTAWLAELQTLTGAGDFFINDSYRSLDLSVHGFDRLFDATWIWRPATAPTPDPALAWRAVTTSVELEAWELAWNGGAASEPPIFLDALLGYAGTEFLAGWRGERIVGGCTVAESAQVVGLTNLFGEPSEVIAAAARAFPGRDLVGYEQREDLRAALSAGFEPVGELTVWRRAIPS